VLGLALMGGALLSSVAHRSFLSLAAAFLLTGYGWAAVALTAATLLVARPVAIWVALSGTGIDRASKAFMRWFGPKGIATMTFSLLLLGGEVRAGARIFDLASLVVFTSVTAHGATDGPGARWIERHAPAQQRVAG
jgi:sodium/hydrogen antiporter